ncbi:MAG: magnesium-protoporphyrin IX monomethyl ester (oxidative) cyclase [Candidatus Eremiobacteraeota bacterium]|nr:magnesium-protoporphyrin IX monomethyl ester (oxidative) cyclase [Candidatus Eremiobacteraeota bacterium]
MSAATAKPKQALLAPRLYRTDIDILNGLSIDWCREEFEALRKDFEADYNRAHFKWTTDVNSVDYKALWDEFYEFLNRSSIGEFSGCLLYSDVQTRLTDPTLQAIYRCMGRDEGRHSSFLNWVMRHMGRPFDLAGLPKLNGMSYMHPKWIFVTTYLSEIVGFYRYQNISDHLKLHPEFNFHPIFDYFDEWCKDERRHSRFFALMMRSQPAYYSGWLSKLGVKFFTLAVYVTMFLRDAQSAIYAKMGMDWEKYDFKVIDETEEAAHGVWGLAIRTKSKFFRNCLRTMAENNRRNKRGRSATGIAKAGAVIMRYARFGNNILQYAKLMAQPHDWVEPLPRSEWTQTCCDPGDASVLALPGAVAVTLRRPAPVAEPVTA